MQTKTMVPLFLSEQVRMICSLICMVVSMVMSFSVRTCMILTLFFLVQIIVKVFAQDDTNMSFAESAIVGPLKVLVSCLMIGLGLPSLESGAGLAWIGVALLFLYSGMQNMYWVFRSGRLNFSTSFNNVAPINTRQQMKAEREEDALLADLASVFIAGDGKEEVK